MIKYTQFIGESEAGAQQFIVVCCDKQGAPLPIGGSNSLTLRSQYGHSIYEFTCAYPSILSAAIQSMGPFVVPALLNQSQPTQQTMMDVAAAVDQQQQQPKSYVDVVKHQSKVDDQPVNEPTEDLILQRTDQLNHQQPPQRRVRRCHNYFRGTCKFAHRCHFSHDESLRDVRNPCFAFQDTGECRFGSNCYYSHDI
jgi:hypothetical protein